MDELDEFAFTFADLLRLLSIEKKEHFPHFCTIIQFWKIKLRFKRIFKYPQLTDKCDLVLLDRPVPRCGNTGTLMQIHRLFRSIDLRHFNKIMTTFLRADCKEMSIPFFFL